MMGWVRLDDGFFQHRKVVDLPVGAKLLFIAGLTHCASQMTDGFVSTGAARAIAGQIGVPTTMAKHLVDVGMWHKRGDGFDVHDYLVYHPTAEQERKRREDTSRRVQQHRIRKRWDDSNGTGNDVTSDVTPPITEDVTNSITPPVSNSVGTHTPEPEPVFSNSGSDLTGGWPKTQQEPENIEMHSTPADDPLVTRWVAEVLKTDTPTRFAVGEAQAIIGHLAEHWSRTRIDEAIGYLAGLDQPPHRATYLLKTCTAWAAEDDITIPPLERP